MPRRVNLEDEHADKVSQYVDKEREWADTISKAEKAHADSTRPYRVVDVWLDAWSVVVLLIAAGCILFAVISVLT